MKLIDRYEFTYREDDLMDVPNTGPVLMSLPPLTDIALRLLPCESPCDHLSCSIDRIGIDEVNR